jgi:two-component system response regulator HydG
MKILVVDDDRLIIKTSCDILRVKGHETLFAYKLLRVIEEVRITNLKNALVTL